MICIIILVKRSSKPVTKVFNRSLYEFSVSFSVDEFVLVEQFYELLKKEFEKHSITQDWTDFMQSYSYKDNKCYYRLWSTNKSGYYFKIIVSRIAYFLKKIGNYTMMMFFLEQKCRIKQTI